MIWAKLFVTEYVFVGYLNGCWSQDDEVYWEHPYYKKGSLSEKWEFWMGWTAGRGKRLRIYG